MRISLTFAVTAAAVTLGMAANGVGAMPFGDPVGAAAADDLSAAQRVVYFFSFNRNRGVMMSNSNQNRIHHQDRIHNQNRVHHQNSRTNRTSGVNQNTAPKPNNPAP